MSIEATEILITNAIYTDFIKYPEADGGPNMEYEWIPPNQSAVCTENLDSDVVVMKSAEDRI